MVILRSQNKITDFLMILAWASPFNCKKANFFKLKVYQGFAIYEKPTYHSCKLQLERKLAQAIAIHRTNCFREVWDLMQWIKRRTFQLAAACLPCEFKACLVRDFQRNIMFLLYPHSPSVDLSCRYSL